jgi:hypothetical protein
LIGHQCSVLFRFGGSPAFRGDNVTRLLSLLPFAAVVFLTTSSGLSADPPTAKNGKPVPPLSELIQVLKDGSREAQVEAAEAIRDHYAGKSLDTVPQLIASMGRELALPPQSNVGRAYLLTRVLAEAAETVGIRRFKILGQAVTDDDPVVRTGAFRLLYTATDDYQQSVNGTPGGKLGLDLPELLKLLSRGVEDESPLVRIEAVNALRAFRAADGKLASQAVTLLSDKLSDWDRPHSKSPCPAYYAASILKLFKAKSQTIKPLARAANQSEDSMVVSESCYTLGVIARDDTTLSAEVELVLVPLVTDTKRKEHMRSFALTGLMQIKSPRNDTVQDLGKLIPDSERLRSQIYQAMIRFGPAAAPVTQILVSRLEGRPGKAEAKLICQTLQAIGPAARDAAGPLVLWSDTVTDRALRGEYEKALRAIGK